VIIAGGRRSFTSSIAQRREATTLAGFLWGRVSAGADLTAGEMTTRISNIRLRKMVGEDQMMGDLLFVLCNRVTV
jgi:hypothetical protein